MKRRSHLKPLAERTGTNISHLPVEIFSDIKAQLKPNVPVRLTRSKDCNTNEGDEAETGEEIDPDIDDDQDWDCPICKKKLPATVQLSDHVKDHLKSSSNCPICKMEFSRSSKTYSHIFAVHMTENRESSSEEEEEPMIDSDSEKGELIIDADSEEEESRNASARDNSDPPEQSCPICNKRVLNLYHHTRIHKPEMAKWRCKTCSKKFFTREDLKRHTITHTKDKPHACPQCDKKYSQQSNLRKHMRVHKAIPKDKKLIKLKSGTELECPLCLEKEIYSDFESFKGHIFASHVPSAGSIICAICPDDEEEEVKNGKELLDHLFKRHMDDTQLGCSTCKMRYRCPSHVESHMFNIHKLEKRICPVCGKWVRNLSTHKKRHFPQNECKECGKKFINEYELKLHHRADHTEDRPFMCKTCDKSFKRSSDLYKHQLVHTGERRFKCNRCSKAFTQSGNLKKHRRMIHGEEDN